MKYILPTIITLAFIGFIALLIIGMVIKSIPFIVTAFILGFVGYAITEHDAEDDTAHITNTYNQHI
jgi:hypothetical protein